MHGETMKYTSTFIFLIIPKNNTVQWILAELHYQKQHINNSV